MVLDHTKVVYTAEDEQGFTFRQINDGLSTLFQTNFFRLFFRYCTGV